MPPPSDNSPPCSALVDATSAATRREVFAGAYDIFFEGFNELILKNVSVEIWAGEILWLVGDSGAGKTLLLEILAGLTRPLLGEVVYGGCVIDCEKDAPPQVGFLPQVTPLDDRLRVWQWLEYRAAKVGIRAEEIWARNPLSRCGCESLRQKQIYDLAPGERRLVALATLFSQAHPAYILDLPFVGLGDAQSELVQRVCREEAEKGAAIVVSSHSTRGFESSAGVRRLVTLADGMVEDL